MQISRAVFNLNVYSMFKMSTETLHQFVSGVLVGVVICLCIFGRGQISQFTWNTIDTKQMGVPFVDFEPSFLARMFNSSLNHLTRRHVTYKGNKVQTEEKKNQTVITCIIPLLENLEHLEQLELGILVTWFKLCDNVLIIRRRRSLMSDKGFYQLLTTLIYRKRSKRKISVAYFNTQENMTEKADINSANVEDYAKPASNTSMPVLWIMSQFKAIKFAFDKYSNTDIYIVTSSVKDVIKHYYKHTNASDSEIETLQKGTFVAEPTVLMLDECLVLGRKAVNKLIKMTRLKQCSFVNHRLLNEWAEQCIKS